MSTKALGRGQAWGVSGMLVASMAGAGEQGSMEWGKASRKKSVSRVTGSTFEQVPVSVEASPLASPPGTQLWLSKPVDCSQSQ